MDFLTSILLIFKNWWWLLIPIILWFPVKSLYLWWIRWEVWYPKFKWILLEIKPPKEILKPFKAMESVFSTLWGIFDAPNWRERWCEGQLPLGGGLWFSFEIASFGGEIHFYMRIPDFFRNTAEAALYAQYPEAEISLVDDYTKYVPQDIPNKDWDMYGENFSLMKPEYYPIKTYTKFFEERPEVPKEEKRLEPMDNLIETLAKLRSGEQVWIQIVCNPITDKIFPWATPGKAEVKRIGGELAKKWFPAEKKGVLPEPLEVLITGKPAAPAAPAAPIKPWPPGELMPGEQEIIQAIEKKISKHGFQTWIRAIHLYKRDQPHFRETYKMIRAYFGQFITENLNSFVYYGPTRSRIHYWLRRRRLHLRKRIQFRRYVDRLPPLWPRTMTGEPAFSFGFAPRGPGIRGTFVLNIEELATIFHLPAKIISPAIAPVEAKKAGPPAGLPTE